MGSPIQQQNLRFVQLRNQSMNEALAIVAIAAPIAVNGIVVAYGYGKLRGKLESELKGIKSDLEELKELHPRTGEK
jgi:AmiR/NasT family two-component response regulator